MATVSVTQQSTLTGTNSASTTLTGCLLACILGFLSTHADVVEHAATSSSSSTTDSQQQKQQQQLAADAAVLSGSIPSRFCGLSVTTAGGSVTVGQIQEADMHLSTAGGDVQVSRCRAVNASISTAAGAAGQQQQVQDAAAPGVRHSGGEIQVGCAGLTSCVRTAQEGTSEASSCTLLPCCLSSLLQPCCSSCLWLIADVSLQFVSGLGLACAFMLAVCCWQAWESLLLVYTPC